MSGFSSEFRSNSCGKHLSWDIMIGWSLGFIIGVGGHTWRGFNPKKPGKRWLHRGYTSQVGWMVKNWWTKRKRMWKPTKRFTTWIFLFSIGECIFQSFHGIPDLLHAPLAGGVIYSFKHLMRRRVPYQSVKNKRVHSMKFWARNIWKNRRENRRFHRRVFKSFKRGFFFMMYIEVAILALMSMFPGEDARHFVDPFFNPLLNPLASKERSSKILDPEIQEYLVDFGEGEEVEDVNRHQYPPHSDRYRYRKGSSERWT